MAVTALCWCWYWRGIWQSLRVRTKEGDNIVSVHLTFFTERWKRSAWPAHNTGIKKKDGLTQSSEKSSAFSKSTFQTCLTLPLTLGLAARASTDLEWRDRTIISYILRGRRGLKKMLQKDNRICSAGYLNGLQRFVLKTATIIERSLDNIPNF